MAGNDNTLQAPASGFGQDVSFATRPDTRGTPTLDGIGRASRGRDGVVGSPGTGSAPTAYAIEAPPPDPTMALLAKIGGKALGEQIKQEKAAAFVTGMQRAAAGEAITDIAEEQPWYSRIFGEADVVEGARTYTAQAKAAETAAAIEDSMPHVRKMGPEQANAYFTELVQKNMTGDDVADAAIMQGFARMLPGTMRRQAKEHYAYRQEQASEAESRAVLAQAGLLQKRAGSDKQTDGEYITNAVQFFASMRPAEGRDVESWTKARTSDLLTLAQSGQFHALNVMKQLGFLDKINVEQRTKVENAIDTAENRTIANKSFEYADELGMIAGQAKVFSTDLSPDATRAALEALNDRFRRETGIDRDLVGLTKAGSIIEDVHQTLLREGERRIREGERAATKAAAAGDQLLAQELKDNAALGAIGLGQAAAASRATGMKPVVDAQFNRVFRAVSSKGPGAAAALLWNNYTGMGSGDGYVSADIKQMYERRVEVSIGANMPADFMDLHAEYAAMYAINPMLADQYFGKHAERMQVYHSILEAAAPGSRSEAMAFTSAFGSQDPVRPKPLSSDDKKAVAGVLAKQHDSPMWKVWGPQRMPLREDQLAYATDDMQSAIAKYHSLPGQGTDLDAAAQRAYAERRRNGADMVGGFYIKGTPGQQPLSLLLKETSASVGTGDDAPDIWDKALAGKIKDMGDKAGFDSSQGVTILRHADTGKVANLSVYFTDKDGRLSAAALSSKDIEDFAKVERTKAQSTKLTLGTHIKPGDYDKGAAIVREQMRNRNK